MDQFRWSWCSNFSSYKRVGHLGVRGTDEPSKRLPRNELRSYHWGQKSRRRKKINCSNEHPDSHSRKISITSYRLLRT